MRYILVITLAASLLTAAGNAQENLIQNGSFDAPGDQTLGWVIDYAFTGNSFYTGNARRVSIVPNEQGRANVMKLVSTEDSGTKVESSLVEFDSNGKYKASLFVKGGPYRIFFACYQWKPGIRPHDKPQPEELRLVYRGKPETGVANSWQKVEVRVPGEKASQGSLQHLQKVRFIRLYVLFARTGFIDEVMVTRIN